MTTQIKTQCPNCYSYFDLPLELTSLLHHPNTPMRCGHCQHDFIINEHLIASADKAICVSSTDSESAHDSDNFWLEELILNLNNEGQPHYSTSATKKKLNQPLDESLTSAVWDASPSSIKSEAASIFSKPLYVPDKILADDKKQLSWGEDKERRSLATLLWLIGCLVLVLALFAQYVVFNLNTLLKNPDHAARLETVCAIAACSLPSADLEAFIIADIDFSASKIENANTFTDIKATLENQSTKTQLLPSLKVSIYDHDSLLGEFIALPEDYLIGRQEQLAAGYGKPFVFTIPISAKQISQVTIKAIY